ncbi:MAG TPA: PilZ domain-containing protein [Kofleriaceae bacterium]|nr:PilZ domain-containing protein [Kofleriaceae bacterium]
MMRRRPPPPPPGGAERREHERYELLAQVELRGSGDVWVLGVRDISAGGMFVELGANEHAAVRSGDRLQICVDLGENDAGAPLRLETAVEVVRITLPGPGRAGGFGVMWTSVDPAAADALGRILAHLRG